MAAPPASQQSELDDALLSGGLDFHVSSDFGAPASTAASGDAPALIHDNSLEFDLSSISLQGTEPKPAVQPQEPLPSLEPAFSESQPALDLRLELAAESMAIGDVESARNLLGEVIAEGDPQLKKRAQDMLDKLGR
jgi:pilus assembly protein FimV